ncbi:MAG: GerMN domain-containing protein [Gemmatimonadales bacterium]|nr:GerMN domain-containing protein [Gemmatimonadales bacterium]
MTQRRAPTTRRPRPPRRQSRVRGIFWIIIIASVACVAYFVWQFMGGDPDQPDLDSMLNPIPGVSEPAGDRAVVLVFPEWDAAGYVTEQRQIPSRDRPDEDLLEIMTLLCEGPKISGAVSALPEGTRALAAFYEPETGAVVLDFSQELVVGHPGGSAAEAATMTSILRSVSLNFPDATSCSILVEGAQVETLAGHMKLHRALDLRRFP